MPLDFYYHGLAGLIIALPAIRWPFFLLLSILAGIGKEAYDFWDYGLFSGTDILYTLLGTSIIACFLLLAWLKRLFF